MTKSNHKILERSTNKKVGSSKKIICIQLGSKLPGCLNLQECLKPQFVLTKCALECIALNLLTINKVLSNFRQKKHNLNFLIKHCIDPGLKKEQNTQLFLFIHKCKLRLLFPKSPDK